MRKVYYYVEACPRCRSRKTGRYIKTPFTGAGYTKEASLKNGELVRFMPAMPRKNAYCDTCGHEWATRIETKLLNSAELEEEKRARGTEPMYQAILARKEKQMRSPAPGFIGWLFPQFGQYRQYQNQTAEEEPEIIDNRGPNIIDSREKTTIEIIYTNDKLIRQFMEGV